MTGYSPVLDSLVRAHSSSPYIESHYFWWTSATYLPAYFFLLHFSISVLKQHSFAPTQTIWFLTLFALYLTELHDFTPLNLLDSNLSYGVWALNTLLTNALNKYHPLIFYFSVSLFFSLSTISPNTYFAKTPFALSFLTNLTLRNSWLVITTNLLSLFLGSWWALQEGTWGGWWNWDSSETFGLEISLIALLFTHSSLSVLRSVRLYIRHLLLTLCFISSYFFIQLNFELVSHNFGSKFFFFFNNNLFSLEVITTLTLACLMLLNLISKLQDFKGLPTRFRAENFARPPVHPLQFLLVITISYWIFWSYRPLLNYFTWNFMNLNLFNFENSLQPANLFLFVLITIWCYNVPNGTYFLPLVPLVLSVNWIWILTLSLRSASISSFTHHLLLSFLLVSISTEDLSVYTWSNFNSYNPFTLLPNPIFTLEEIFTLDGLAVEMSQNDVTLKSRLSQNWNLLTTSNTPSINFFSLSLTHTGLKNHYNLGISYTTILLELDLPALPSLPSLFFLCLTFVWISWTRTTLILS